MDESDSVFDFQDSVGPLTITERGSNYVEYAWNEELYRYAYNLRSMIEGRSDSSKPLLTSYDLNELSRRLKNFQENKSLSGFGRTPMHWTRLEGRPQDCFVPICLPSSASGPFIVVGHKHSVRARKLIAFLKYGVITWRSKSMGLTDSVLCGSKYCCAQDHIIIEPMKIKNDRQRTCFKHTVEECSHDPACLIIPSIHEESNEVEDESFPLLVFENENMTILDMSRYMTFPIARVAKELGVAKSTVLAWLKKYCKGRPWGFRRVKDINREIQALRFECKNRNVNKRTNIQRFREIQQRKLQLLKERRRLLAPARVKLTPNTSRKLRERFKPK